MYNHIFEIEKQNIAKKQRIKENDIPYDDPFRSEADWIEDVDQKHESDYIITQFLISLNKCCEGFCTWYSLNDGETFSIEFDKGFKEKYFSHKYEAFTEEMRKMSNILNLQNFTNGNIGLALWNMEQKYDEKLEEYVIDSSGTIQTLDSFIRTATPNKIYYIGNVMQYHA